MVTQSVHSAVCIFIFCVLISKDGPKRFQGSVIDGVMYILRTAMKEMRGSAAWIRSVVALV